MELNLHVATPMCLYLGNPSLALVLILSDRFFAFVLKKMQQNTHSVFLHLLVNLRTSFRQFW